MRPTLRITITAAALLVGAAAVAVLYSVCDPSAPGWPLHCPSKLVTGLQCPGCGSQRALHAMLTGHWADVWRYNAILPPALAMMALLAAARIPGPRTEPLRRLTNAPATGYTVLAAVLLWTLIRNIAGC